MVLDSPRHPWLQAHSLLSKLGLRLGDESTRNGVEDSNKMGAGTEPLAGHERWAEGGSGGPVGEAA